MYKDLFDSWFGTKTPEWREKFEDKIYELERKTQLPKEKLLMIADVIQDLGIIKE